ncbi:MAG: hypothetical protein JWP95_830 [Actinotalea sp.]|nr:hypothetical protein [Actinotalea sp.]
MAEQLEHLVVRGRLDRAGDFTPRRCYSTRHVHTWPRGTTTEELDALGAGRGEVVVETVADDGVALQRELAQVRRLGVCAPGDTPVFRVVAYVGLHPRAVAVRVRRDERVLWEMRIPEQPRVEVRLERAPVREGRRGRDAVLVVDHSEPADESLAFLTVVHRWSERRYSTVYLGPVREEIQIPQERLPGGRECRLLVTYSDGLRAATAATEPFGLEPIGATVTIVRPAEDEQATAGVPLVLEGSVVDREDPRGPLDAERLVWTVDGEQVGTGPVTSVDRLDAGRHEVTLTYRAEEEASATVRFRVSDADGPTADEWPEWDTVDVV